MNEDDRALQRLHDLHQQPVVQDYLHHIAVIAGFSLPPSVDKIFGAYHQYCFSEPPPEFTRGWGPESPTWRWQKLHNECILGSAQAAATAVFYHRENLLRLERDLVAFLDLEELVRTIAESAIGGGNTQKLDFEYHAFVFAYRRCLDYLARGASSLLKEEVKSFRDIPKLLNNHSHRPWVRALVDIQTRYVPEFGSFMTGGEGKSVRDQIAHYAHVPAGALNVNVNGVFFAGGGENLGAGKRLADVLNSYVRLLRAVIAEVLDVMKQGLHAA